jgi:hypothetical protein
VSTDAIREQWAEMKAGRPRPALYPPRTERRPDGLTERQFEVFRLLYESARDRGYQPSIRSLCAALGMRSPNAMSSHLRALARAGWLRPGGGESRSVEFLRTLTGQPFRGFLDRGS